MTVPLIVLVPVLDRPKNVEPLVESFVVSDTPGELVFIVNGWDEAEIEAIEAAGARYVPADGISWPNKINEAFKKIHDEQLAEWVLFGADDIAFHSGWFENTKPLRDQPEVMVIGTNDLGNPRVIAGDHTTHPLVRGSYIGTVDDPESIVHTGYRHWFVDDEFLYTAKLRGVWAFCPTAVVEHLHPYWNKSEWDATYAQGELGAKRDAQLWSERAPLLGLQVSS